MQAWGTIGTYEAREEANPIPQDSSPLNDACNVGGLLATVIHHGPDAGVYFPFYDGNGNVMGYVRGADGLLAAQYEYGPFGELLRATGPLSQTFNPLFSTKYHDWETGLLYYGHRYYNPTTGRWLFRDPIEENGGMNLYGFIENDPVQYVDVLGLQKDAACVNQCYKNLEACYSAGDIALAMTGGGVGAVAAAASGVMGCGPHTTPTGRDKMLLRGGKPTQYCKNLAKSGGASFLAGVGVGILAFHAKCLAGFAGCLSGCPDVPEPKKCPAAPGALPGPPNCNVNAPSACLVFPKPTPRI